MTDDDSGSRALTSVGYPDGSSASVFKAEGYKDSNPQYMVKHWGKDGEENEYMVNPTQVNPEDASYIGMLAYSTYLELTGQAKNGFGDFLTVSRGVNGDWTYDAENMNTKMDFPSLVMNLCRHSMMQVIWYLSFRDSMRHGQYRYFKTLKETETIDISVVKITTEMLRKYLVEYQSINNCGKVTIDNIHRSLIE